VASVAEQGKGKRTLVFQYRIGGKRHRTQARIARIYVAADRRDRWRVEKRLDGS
jgi:hypothetical protein